MRATLRSSVRTWAHGCSLIAHDASSYRSWSRSLRSIPTMPPVVPRALNVRARAPLFLNMIWRPGGNNEAHCS